MRRLSSRDQGPLTEEESKLKGKLLNSISGDNISESWGQFYSSVENAVDLVADEYINNILKNDVRYKKVQELDSLWQQFPPEVRMGKVPSLEADRISELSNSAEGELESYKLDLTNSLDKIKASMIAQIISSKVE